MKEINSLDKQFLDDYWSRYKKIIFDSRNDKEIINFRDQFLKISENKGKLIFIGNGASASLASHASTDFTKQAKIKSLAFNDHNLVTALANDYGYENWVSAALDYYCEKKDAVIFISVSGNSPNLIKGLDFAKSHDILTFSLTGASISNYLNQNSDHSIWVDSKAYNIVESIHTILITLIIDLIVGKPEYKVS